MPNLRGRLAVLATSGLIAACAGVAPPSGPAASVPAAGVVAVDVTPVPLNPADASQVSVGDFHYAGGLQLSSRATDRLHGLSAIVVSDTTRLTAVGDEGILFEARLVLDAGEALTGLTDARITPLVDRDGSPLSGRTEADAEGLAPLGGHGLLISFERVHRVWLYPDDGGPPRPAPVPAVALPSNNGLEALTADPDAGPDAYVLGAEATGATWVCRLTAPCQPGPTVMKPRKFGLVAMHRMSGQRTAYLLRAWDEARGSRIALEIHGPDGVIARMDLAGPMTVDNFEGVAVVPRPDGPTRFYLLSDDNGSAEQRTLLLAFDWRP